jgi:hypothetical protein
MQFETELFGNRETQDAAPSPQPAAFMISLAISQLGTLNLGRRWRSPSSEIAGA